MTLPTLHTAFHRTHTSDRPHAHAPMVRRFLAAIAILPLLAANAGCGSASTDATSSASPSRDNTVSWLSQTDWNAHPANDTALKFFGVIDAPIKASDLFDHATDISVEVASGDGTKAMTDKQELLTSTAAKPSDDAGDSIVMDDSFGGVTLNLHYELDNSTTPISDVFSKGLFDIAYTPDSTASLEKIVGIAASDSDSSSAALDAVVDTYGQPTGIWYWNDTSYFDPTNAANGGIYEMCWERDGYTFTITVQDTIGTEYSIANTSFTYYSGAAWDSFKKQLESGSIDGTENNVKYWAFTDFYNSYLSPEAVASLQASASAAASLAAASARATGSASESETGASASETASASESGSTAESSATASTSGSSSTDAGSESGTAESSN